MTISAQHAARGDRDLAAVPVSERLEPAGALPDDERAHLDPHLNVGRIQIVGHRDLAGPIARPRSSGRDRPARPARHGMSLRRSGHARCRTGGVLLQAPWKNRRTHVGGRPAIRIDSFGLMAARGENRRNPSGERYLTEDLLDPPQVAHPGLGRAADPAADGLDRDTELLRCRFLGKALPAQRGRHPVGERFRQLAAADRRLRGHRGRGGRTAAGTGHGAGAVGDRRGPGWPFAAGPARRRSGRPPGCRRPGRGRGSAGCRSAARQPRRAQGRSGRPPGSSRSAPRRRAARGTPSRRPRLVPSSLSGDSARQRRTKSRISGMDDGRAGKICESTTTGTTSIGSVTGTIEGVSHRSLPHP